MGQKVIQQEKVYLDNKFIKGIYDLGLVEKRMIYLVLGKIDQRTDTYDKEYSFDYATYQEVFGEYSRDSNLERIFETAIDKLSKAQIIISNDEKYGRFHFVQGIYLDKEAKKVYMTFTKYFASCISQFTNCFTSIGLISIAKIDSVYSLRLFELLSVEKFKGISGNLRVNYKELAEQWATTKTYLNDGFLFKRDILIPAINHLLKKDSLKKLSFKDIKEGRKIVGCILSYQFYHVR